MFPSRSSLPVSKVVASSTGPLPAKHAWPGASAYFVGGGVIYTGTARERLLGVGKEEMRGLRPATEAHAKLTAQRLRERLGDRRVVLDEQQRRQRLTPRVR